MPSPDPLRAFQRAAREFAEQAGSEERVIRVIFIGLSGQEILRVCVPPSCPGETPTDPLPVVPPAGWSFTEKTARFDGRAIEVSPSRVKLLRVLAESAEKMSARELAKAVFGEHGDEESARHHVRHLRKELQSAFGYEGDPIPNDGSGYWLVPM